ncbi:MAG: DUF2085 domain-containing protein [Chloroflexota bacterium]|nr:DUF2085 domain-containing protein [Chloroflexota bacterium]MBI5702256.1 DUF2085 domain-containing protein [Chloroflexota bacterium]
MEQTASPTKADLLARWLLPLAALIVLGVWFYIAPPGILGKADSIGYAVCHRIDERSFHIFGRQLPLCARCTGEFYAAGLTLIILAILSPKRSGMPGWKLGAPLLFFLFAFALDGSNSYLYLLKQTSSGVFENIPNIYVPNNTLRLFTGSGMGIALASILYPAFNSAVWKNYNPASALDWKKLGVIVGVVLVIDLLILTEHPAVLYPIAILSALGTLSLLVIVFSMVWLLMMRLENTFDSLAQMWMPFLAGMTLALLLITLIDLLRLRLTGTWGGFPLG